MILLINNIFHSTYNVYKIFQKAFKIEHLRICLRKYIFYYI